MSAATIISKIPWGKIKKYGPIIIKTASILYEKLKERFGKKDPNKSEPSSTQSLEDRISRLESNELQQAELVSNIAKQLEELTTGLEITSKRATLSLVFSAVALAVTMTLLLINIFAK